MAETDKIGTGRPSYEELEALVASQAALIVELQAELAGLRAQVVELKGQLGGNSRNSSRPPSSDGYAKPPAGEKSKTKRSLRRSSGRKQGGQEGHEGARLEPVEVPDERVEHPPERCDGCAGDLAGAQVSTGTLSAWVTQAAAGLGDFDEQLRELLVASPIVHFDETGARIAGRLGWVHSASTADLTRYSAHRRRGCEAIDDAGVLPDFQGVAVHDGWKPYRKYTDCEHALCNPHHLRELEAAAEAGHAWPAKMGALLLGANETVKAARARGEQALSADARAAITERYRAIVASGHEEHPSLAATKVKRTKAHNLLLRLERDQAETLRFAYDFRVPFSNNQAEQDIRMIKLQQKISGCWRTPEGAERFLAIRSYISTARKNGIGALDGLGRLAAGEPWMPAPTAAPT